jgi:hypothetical protein
MINSIEHFYHIAERCYASVWETTTTTTLSEILGRPVTKARVYRAWRELNRRYTRTAAHTPELLFLKSKFSCDEEVAMRLFVSLAMGVDEPEEMRIVPILTVTLVETLLNLLLIDIIAKVRNVDRVDATKSVSKLLSFDARYQEFQSLTGVLLASAIEQSHLSFWSDWEYVRQRRNNFVHGRYYALGWLACERSWNVTIRSVPVFSSLHNSYAV